MRIVLFLIGLTIVTFACNLFTLELTPTPVPAPVTETPPASPVAPPPAAPPEAGYLLQEERLINGYAVRFWRNPEDQLGVESIC